MPPTHTLVTSVHGGLPHGLNAPGVGEHFPDWEKFSQNFAVKGRWERTRSLGTLFAIQ